MPENQRRWSEFRNLLVTWTQHGTFPITCPESIVVEIDTKQQLRSVVHDLVRGEPLSVSERTLEFEDRLMQPPQTSPFRYPNKLNKSHTTE